MKKFLFALLMLCSIAAGFCSCKAWRTISTTATRAKNLSTLSQDQVAYLAQKDQPGGAKTWKSYLWKLAKAAVTGE